MVLIGQVYGGAALSYRIKISSTSESPAFSGWLIFRLHQIDGMTSGHRNQLFRWQETQLESQSDRWMRMNQYLVSEPPDWSNTGVPDVAGKRLNARDYNRAIAATNASSHAFLMIGIKKSLSLRGTNQLLLQNSAHIFWRMGRYLNELQQKLARLQQNKNEEPVYLSPENGEERSPG